jgi:hypothetical protein
MNGQMGQMDRQTNEWIDGTNRQTDKDRWINRQTVRQSDRWTKGQTDEDRQTQRLTDKQTNG